MKVVLSPNLIASVLDCGTLLVVFAPVQPPRRPAGRRNRAGNQKPAQALGAGAADTGARPQTEPGRRVRARPAAGLDICCGFVVKRVITRGKWAGVSKHS